LHVAPGIKHLFVEQVLSADASVRSCQEQGPRLCIMDGKFHSDFPGKGKVAVVKTTPETVLQDYARVMELAGVPHIQFREVNEADQARIDFFIPLDTTHDQIALILDHPIANSDAIFGRFQYFDGGVGGAVTSFLTSIDIFNGELFTVPRFNAQVGLVSEPLTLALVLTGLTLIGWMRSGRISSTPTGCTKTIS